MKLRDKVVFITGGSRGLGRVIALACAREGATVALFARSRNRLNEVEAAVRDAGGAAVSLTGDITDSATIDAAFAETVERFGTLDVLVNNVGHIGVGSFCDMSDEQWRKTFDINLLGVVRCSRAALRTMVPRKSGRIINISSAAARNGPALMAAYGGSKAAAIALTRALAAELVDHDIAVNAINPSTIETDSTYGGMSRLADSMGTEVEAIRNGLIASTPIGRFVTLEEVADAVVWLSTMSSPLSYTGQCLDINGGRFFA